MQKSRELKTKMSLGISLHEQLLDFAYLYESLTAQEIQQLG